MKLVTEITNSAFSKEAWFATSVYDRDSNSAYDQRIHMSNAIYSM